MAETHVVNKRKDWYDEYIGRGSTWGNPYTHKLLSKTKARFQCATRDEAIDKYREWFEDKINRSAAFRRKTLALRGKRLGCYCKPGPCHGDVIVEWLENNKK